jgi:hypothetical protein
MFRMLFFMMFWRKKFICVSLLVLLIHPVPSICVALRRRYMGLNKLRVLGMPALDRLHFCCSVLSLLDDIIVISSFKFATAHLVTALGADFAVKDLDKLHYFLGFEVTHCDARLTIT